MFRFFEFITEMAGGLLIFASPLLTGLGIGAAIYFPNPTLTRLIAGIAVAAIGLITGVIWASKIWKKGGTIRFLSRISGTPDLDEKLKGGNK